MAISLSQLLGLLSEGVRNPKRIGPFIGKELSRIPNVTKREVGFKATLVLRGADLNPDFPELDDVKRNAVLKSSEDVESAISSVQTYGLHPHQHRPKNWDALIALKSILSDTDRDSRIMDAGGAPYSPLVEWLYLFGYSDLYVSNIAFDSNSRRGPIEYVECDFTDTEFRAGTFDAITTLSVIEHGVDLEAMLMEFYRLLKPGGTLIISTDYYPEEIDTGDTRTVYGDDTQKWNLFDDTEIKSLVNIAADIGFELVEELELEADERVVSWRGFRYTFIVFQLRKPRASGNRPNRGHTSLSEASTM